MRSYDVAIIGAGPIGLKVANFLSEELSVLLLEEHKNIGYPEKCAGLISKETAEFLSVPLKRILVNEIFGAKIHVNRICMEVFRDKPVAYVIERPKLEQELFSGIPENIDVRLGTSFLDFRNGKIFVKKDSHGELFFSKILVGCDGALSKVRRSLGINVSPSNFVFAYQARARGKFEQSMVEVFFVEEAKNFFAWIVPENEEVARIGLATAPPENPKKAFDRFLKRIEKEYSLKGFFGSFSAVIPIGRPLKAYFSNVLLAGDSAFHVKATTGGGLAFGLLTAEKCAEAINDYFEYGISLKNYEKAISKINSELLLHWKLRKTLNSFSIFELENILKKLKDAGVEEFLSSFGNMDRPSEFIFKILKKPKLFAAALPLIPKAIMA